MRNQRIATRAVLFDWDGTLLNSYGADSRAYLSMFRALGINWNIEDLARNYSPNWLRVYRAARLPQSRWKEADRLWHLAYDKETPRLLPGARNVLRRLGARFILGLVTSGNRRRVRRQLRDFELARYFRAVVCAEDASHRKPHPAPLRLALDRLGLAADACVYVGDAPDDIFMARRAGVRAIGVAGPFPTAARVRAARPDTWLDSIAELPRKLSLLSERG
ncbi:MAG: HAD family hydrolase [Candidatus Acidiferrales bacterium]